MSLPTGRIIVTGAPQSGKSTFINSVFGNARTIFIPVDLLRVVVDQTYLVYMEGLQLRNLRLDDSIQPDLRAVFLMVDSTDIRHVYEAKGFLKLILACYQAPCMILANKQDHETALTIGQIRREIEMPETVDVLPCIATDIDNARALFLRGLRFSWPDVRAVTS